LTGDVVPFTNVSLKNHILWKNGAWITHTSVILSISQQLFEIEPKSFLHNYLDTNVPQRRLHPTKKCIKLLSISIETERLQKITR
jgi:hypothetical protein